MNRETVIGILKKDFDEYLEKIDFEKTYNPCGESFDIALRIGQMIAVIKESDDDVAEELEGAEKYFALYKETSDGTYKEMASDELKHAGILIKKHLSKAIDDSVKEKLNEYDRKRQDMIKAIATATVPLKD